MATFNKFYQFADDLGSGVHGSFKTGNDTLNVYLSNEAPIQATDATKSDVAEISTGNGYTGPEDTQNDASESGGVLSVTGVDVVINATGSVGPFQYVILYNDTPTSPADPLIGWWDYGSEVTLQNGESFTVDFGTEMFTIT